MKLAVGELKAAVDRGVSTTTLFNDRGAIWDKAKQFTRAETEYSRGLDIDPTDVNLRNNRGWVYYELKQYDKARDDFAIAAQRTPDSPREFIARAESHSGLGLAYAALGAPVEALQEAGRAWMFLERGRADHHIVWHNIACIYGELSKASDDKQFNRYDELALEFLRRAVKSGGQSSRDRIEREKQFFPEWLRDKDEYQRLLTPTPEK
jgi:tetratricopeptide (TPR) repeat protein